MSRRTPALALALTAAILASAPSAIAQTGSGADGKPTPSASGLWKKYPLHPTPTATGTVGAGDATPVAERTENRSSAVRSSDDGSTWSPALIVLIAIVAVATVGVWTLVLLRRRRGPQGAGGRRRSALPPDPARSWTAAIDWIQEGDGAHFRVLARAKGEPGTTPILRSAVLPWPPADSGAVDAMTKAVERLELRLLDAGWTPTEPGRAWYEKRFSWAPAPVPTAKPKRPAQPKPAAKAKPVAKPKPAAKAKPAAGAKPTPAANAKPKAAPKQDPKPAPKPERARPKAKGERSLESVRRPAAAPGASAAGAATTSRPAEKRSAGWPPDAKGLWRCEIRFDAGYSASRFTATVHPPAGSEERSRVIARSESLRWLFMSPPDAKVPEHRNAALALARALRGAGWEVVGRGGGWYAERYVWRGEGDPPAHVEVPVNEERRGEGG